MITRRSIPPWACLLFVAGCRSAAPPQDAALAVADSIVSDWVDQERVPGAVLLVSRGSGLADQKAYGWAQKYEYDGGSYGWPWALGSGPAAGAAPGIRRSREPRPMTTETVFDLASVTKVMATTFAVLLLVDRGRLDLDASVSEYLPDFTGAGKESITPRHLLTHRSGLYQWQPVYYHAQDEDEAYAYIRDLELAWGVGEGRHYSDLGFMLLGRIVEEISGDSLDGFLRDELYAPLGLSATAFRPTVDRDGTAGAPTAAVIQDGRTFAATSHGNPFEYRMVHDSTFGYRYAGDSGAWSGWRRYTAVAEVNDGNSFHAFGGVAGHAGLFSTVGELNVLLRLLIDGGERDGIRYIRAETMRHFLESTGDGQALGWQTPDYVPATGFSHTGFTGTFVMGVRSTGLAVVLLTNRQNGGVDAETAYPDVGPLQRAVVAALTAGS